MKNLIKTKTPFVITFLFFFFFTAVFVATLPFKQMENVHAGKWVAFGFMELAFVIVALVTLLLKLQSKNTMTTIWPIMYVVAGYFVLALITNVILILVNSENFVPAIALNFVWLFLFALGYIIAYKSFSRVQDNTVAQKARMASLRTLSVKVNSLCFLTEDATIQAAIKKLKENVDYSSSAGNEASKSYEEQLDAQIETISMLLNSRAEQADVLKAVQTAENLLKVRNQMLMIR